MTDLRRGLLLAGGRGTRLDPLTRVVTKQILPVYNKPMIYYPLSTLIELGIREVLVISTPRDLKVLGELLGSGDEFGMVLRYAEQAHPLGIAEALIIGEQFLDGCPSALVLGDNLLVGTGLTAVDESDQTSTHARFFGYYLDDPRDYGVLEFSSERVPIRIAEKPSAAPSNYAVPGLYLYPPDASYRARQLRPSGRGELEITDLNNEYLAGRRAEVTILPSGTGWLDMGSFESLYEASSYVRTLERRQGRPIGSPHVAAVEKGWIESAS
jgi:glucose-1-phosphate thymidylyltransferase